MARQYTVQIPGGGEYSVNANSAEAARQNVGLPGAVVHAGGYAHSGPEEYSQSEMDVYRSQNNSDGGQNNYNPGSNTVPNPPAKGNVYGYDAPGGADATTDQTKNIYGRRGTERMDQYMQRVFQQATRAGSPGLNPYMEENPFANSPYARWFQDRYAQTVPANIMLQRLLGNEGGGQDFEPYMQSELAQSVSHGKNRGFGTGLQGAGNNLGRLNGIVEQLGAGNQSGMSADQIAMGNTLKDDPAMALQMVNAQMQGAVNPFGMDYITNLGRDMAANYHDDAVGHDPAKNGAFLTNLLKKLNMA